MVEAIFGAEPAKAGEIEHNGETLGPARPNASVKRGIGLLTEDRKRTGLCLNLPMSTNVTLANVRALIQGGRLQHTAELAETEKYIRKQIGRAHV